MLHRIKRWIDGQIEADARGEDPITILRRFHTVPIGKMVNGLAILVNALFFYRYGLAGGDPAGLMFLAGAVVGVAAHTLMPRMQAFDSLVFAPTVLVFLASCSLLGLGGDFIRTFTLVALAGAVLVVGGQMMADRSRGDRN